jgi:hypothetical protein
MMMERMPSLKQRMKDMFNVVVLEEGFQILEVERVEVGHSGLTYPSTKLNPVSGFFGCLSASTVKLIPGCRTVQYE